jgi:hypothetical protein
MRPSCQLECGGADVSAVTVACTYVNRDAGGLVGGNDLQVTACTGTAGGVAGDVVIEPLDSGGCAVALRKRDGMDTGE